MSIIQSDDLLVQEMKTVNELIHKFFEIFKLKKERVKLLSSVLYNLQKEFESKYLKFSNIKRFAIPFIGRISCGKSTFLSFLTGLNNILETNTDITTKIVFIIRHNILAEEPKAFNVILEKRNLLNEENDNSIPKFNFEKGEELKGDIKEIIEEKNKYIKVTKPELLKNEDFFMIIEAKLPLFNEELEKYSKIFEFMDLPGLNENNKNDFKTYILPCISFNVKFSFFIFDCLSIKDRDSNNIYDEYKDLFNIEFENNFYILNKIDYSTDEIKIALDKFKKTLSNDFNVKIDKNYFLTANSLLLTKELNKYLNFNSYLLFKEEEIKNVDFGLNFKKYLIKEMKKDLSIESLGLKEIHSNANEVGNININNFLNDLNNKLENKGFGEKLEIADYFKFKTIFDKNNKKRELNIEILNQIRNNISNSFKNSVESFVELKNFKNDLEQLIKNINIDNIIEKIKTKSNFMHSINKMKKIKEILLQLEKLEPNNEFIKKIMIDYEELINFLEIHSKIRISVLGLYSS